MESGWFAFMLTVFQEPIAAAKWCEQQRKQNQTIGFVPTMGALHRGHLSLVDHSIAENDVTCVSIFVNPLQFNQTEDYCNYPRDMEADYAQLEEKGCDMVFSGTSRDMFPEASDLSDVKLLDPGPAGRGLEGQFRPGHFEGVCTIVERLFKFVGDCQAYFGLKDYQQTQVIQALAQRLGYPTIRTCETIRDENGLALSSRNTQLSEAELLLARSISRALRQARHVWQTGTTDSEQLRAVMRTALAAPLRVDYADVRDPDHWQVESPYGPLEKAIALIAAWIGSVRLIDNLRLDSKD